MADNSNEAQVRPDYRYALSVHPKSFQVGLQITIPYLGFGPIRD
jgi:hypothetical protein